MSFDPSVIADLKAAPDAAADLVVTWTTSSPGSLQQLYIDGRLAWEGFSTVAIVPMPTGPARIDVGAILPGEAGTDFSASLTAPPGGGNRAALSWTGGTYLDSSGDVAGFRVYGSAVPGGAVDGTRVLATVPAYVGDVADGFGLGGFGQGGFGFSASSYGWTSGPLSPGVWSFRVDTLDAAGNESAGATASVTIAGPPRPPAPFADGKRLHLAYNATTHVATLTWNAPPP